MIVWLCLIFTLNFMHSASTPAIPSHIASSSIETTSNTYSTPNMTSYATSKSPPSPSRAVSTIDNRLPILPSSQYIVDCDLLGGNSEDHGHKNPTTTSTSAIPSDITSSSPIKASSSSIRHGFECTVITDITFPTPPPPQHVSSPSPTKDLLGGNSHSHQHKNPTTTSTSAIPSHIISSSPTKAKSASNHTFKCTPNAPLYPTSNDGEPAIFTASSMTDNVSPATDTKLNLTVSPLSNASFQAIYIESTLPTRHSTPNMTSYATSNSPPSPTLAASTIDNGLSILQTAQPAPYEPSSVPRRTDAVYVVNVIFVTKKEINDSLGDTTDAHQHIFMYSASTSAIPSRITSSSPTKAKSTSNHTFKYTPNAPLYCTSNDGEPAMTASSMTDSLSTPPTSNDVEMMIIMADMLFLWILCFVKNLK